MSQIDSKMIAEYLFIKKLVTEIYTSGICSVVSDTFDFFRVLTEIVPRLKTEILSRKPDALGNAKVVFRPDSGNPVDIICGVNITTYYDMQHAVGSERDNVCDMAHDACEGSYNCGADVYTQIVKVDEKYFELEFDVEYNRHDKRYYYVDGVNFKGKKEIALTPAQKGAVECLWDVFGGTKTEKGYKVLDSHVGLIYGDSITIDVASQILERLEKKGFASCNVVFGIGSHTYQYVTRDTFGSAMKATWGMVSGEERVLFKQPKTDTGMKNSARGLLRVEETSKNEFVLFEEQTREQQETGSLQTVFVDGFLERFETLEEVRDRLNS